MVSRLSSIAVWAVALCFLCFAVLSNASDTPHHPHAKRDDKLRRRSVVTKAPEWTKMITLSPAHQNPSKAPPNPIDLEHSKDSPESLEQYYKDAANATESSAGVTPNRSRNSPRTLLKRGSGPLYCKDGPCADDSCCGPEGICGYGPDYCLKGCTSNCDAYAMCGQDSEGVTYTEDGEYDDVGEMPCGMNLCCSASGWCGTTEAFCGNADPVHDTLPCQAGYGSCNIASSPSCAKGSGSTNGRTIGYYQSWSVRTRKCDTRTPKQLNTKGYTHLFYSFAFIDPTSFAITPAHDDDIEQMREFTGLSKNSDLKTWIAIGGFDMSNPEAPTHTTWSDMVSTKANRAAFIESVRDYMDEYGFTGVDIDWEYPGEPKRGGRKLSDTRGFATLLKEMRAAYGDKYGISLTLAPDYWYLRWFDAKAMEPYVDFFGFMAYDLHGSWDEDVKTLGSVIRGQADIREIDTNTIPLWFDGLDPKKINFGLAMYGRGYTVSDKSCNGLGCSFSGPSKKGECTDSDGVMSLGEIKNLIKNKGVESTYLKDSMMKQIAWDDQWIGYDDEETFIEKKAWADSYCFGGTMVWSIDFQEQSNDDDSDGFPIKAPGGGTVLDPDSGSGSGNSDVADHKNTPFREFRGCTAREKQDIVQSWWDTIELVRLAAGTDFNKKPGELESRVFGFDVHKREGAGDFVHMIYANILELYTEKIYGKIRMSCEDIVQTHKTKSQQSRCAREVYFGEVGGYAFSYSEKLEDQTIVLCKPFFESYRLLLEPLIQNLRDNKEYQKDPHQMNGKTRILLHEMTHLAAISETPAIEDQPLREEAIRPELVYGPRLVQQMGMYRLESVRDRTQLNADSYAMYATWKYFGALFGTPNAVDMPRDDGLDTLVCAPTDTNGPVLSRDNIKGRIDAWCDSLDGKTISQDDTRKEQVWHYGSAKPGSKLTDLVFSANWVQDVEGEGCPNRTRGTVLADCKIAMAEVLDTCGGKDGMDGGSPRYGGSQQGECVIWDIEIVDNGVVPADPPEEQEEQEGCEAHIALNTSNGLEIANPTSKWELSITDTAGHQVGEWAATNPADIHISTTKGYNFVIEGHPSGSFLDGKSFQDSLTLSYHAQKWNGLDCYRYIQKSARPSNGWRHQYDWWCKFDC